MGAVYLSPYDRDSKELLELFHIAKRRNIPIKTVSRGDLVEQSKFNNLTLLYPPSLQSEMDELQGSADSKMNNRCIVLELTSFGKRFLFMADTEKGAEMIIAREYKHRVNVLELGHHGSKTSTSEEFLDTIKPELSVISLGRYNHFHFPAPVVIERLKSRNIPVFRTDQTGCIEFRIRENFFLEQDCE